MQGDTQAPAGAEPTLIPPVTGEVGVQAPSAASPDTEGDRLATLLPELEALARKVGGFEKLAELARELAAAGR